MKLYKYTRLEYALDIIKNNRIFLNSPENFNDPFDCVPNPDENGVRAAGELIVNYFHFIEAIEYIKKYPNKLPSEMEKAILDHAVTLKTILKLYPRYSKWSYIDDIVKKHGSRSDEIAIKNRKQKLINSIYESMQQSRKHTLVSCLSKTNNSILLWSHYADSHKGACIEFEVAEKESDLVGICYQKERSKFDILDVTSMILALEFLGEPFVPNDQEYNLRIMKPYYTKSMEWSYEQEVRYILNSIGSNRVLKVDNRCFIESPKIISITFGCSVDRTSHIFYEILKEAKDRNICVKFTEPNKNAYAIDEIT